MSEAFNPDYLRQHLRPLAAAEADAAVLAYQAYYGLDLRSRHPRLQARLGSMAVDGRRLAVQAWLLPEARGSLLLMHGYYDHMGLYRHVVDWALGMGFSVLACDLPGHGLSEGERASIRDFAEYQAVFKGLLGQAAELDLAAPWHLCGQSTGGAILLDYLLHGGERPELGETGDAEILKKFLLYRTYHGCAMPVQTQLASIAAWNDEVHVRANRSLYREKFDAVLAILDGVLDVQRPDGSFYLWARTPVDDTVFTRELFEQQHVTVVPGSYLSREVDGENPGANRVRMALVAPLAECVEAAERIRDYLRAR